MSQPYKSGRQQNLNLGITSVTENKTVLQVTGKVGIGTTNATSRSLYVIGDAEITGVTTLASAGGITTTGGDLYVGGDLYIADDLVFDEFTSRNGNISGILTVRNVNVTGIATITNIVGTGATIGRIVAAATSFSQLQVSGISTFTNGPVFIGSGTTTGTASQRLQITGGAYVSGAVGVGTTNPRETLDVIGTIGIQSTGAANRFEIQHNAALNSLDFIFV